MGLPSTAAESRLIEFDLSLRRPAEQVAGTSGVRPRRPTRVAHKPLARTLLDVLGRRHARRPIDPARWPCRSAGRQLIKRLAAVTSAMTIN
jgi:hypothetical protein